MNFQDLKKNLDELKPVYLIKGSDAFLRSKATEMLINHAVTLKDLNCSIFTDENTDMSAILSACRSIPMLDTKKVVVLRDINIKKVDDIKPLLEYVQKPLTSTILIIVDSRNVTTYKKIEPYCELIDCSPLDSDMLAKLVATQLKSYGCAINKDALQKLVEYCNADYTRINNETIKLGNLLGQGGVVTTQIIEENIHREVEYDIFELGNYAAQKNGQKAMEIINHLLERKESPQMLLIMVLNNFRRMFFAVTSKDSPAQIAAQLGVKEFAIKKAKEVGSKFTPAQLKKILDLGADLDYQIKSGGMNEKNALIYFISSIVK